jgi:DNA-binding MarR family transcriptional regulator
VKSGAVAKRVSNITKQALGEFVTDLQTAGLVDVKPDPSDGRARLVTPTPSGRRTGRAGMDYWPIWWR